MRLDPFPPSVKRLLSPGDEEPLSPVLSLEPGASCDPERVDLGLQPLLGTIVHVSQVRDTNKTMKEGLLTLPGYISSNPCG